MFKLWKIAKGVATFLAGYGVTVHVGVVEGSLAAGAVNLVTHLLEKKAAQHFTV